MIDWVTVRITYPERFHDAWSAYLAAWVKWERVERGELVCSRYDWDRIRSDSCEVSVCPLGNGLVVAGSPARAAGLSSNLFWQGGIEEAAQVLVRAAEKGLHGWAPGVPLGSEWKVTRVDVTHNYVLESATAVRDVLASIGGIETGKYRTSRKHGSTVYLGGKSRTRKGKAYSKGAHVRYQIQRGEASIEEGTLGLIDRVLRLELTYGRDYWRERDWRDTLDIENDAADYWGRLFGDAEAEMVGTERERVEAFAKSKREATAVYRTLLAIRSEGSAAAEGSVSRATWFRHKRVLRLAGFGEGEVHGAAKVLRFPVRAILCHRVESWEELHRHAA